MLRKQFAADKEMIPIDMFCERSYQVFPDHGFKLKKCAAISLLLASALSNAQAGNYSNVYFFGDSLTDSGVYAPTLTNPAYSHFSTNPGLVWSQQLGLRYGLSVSPAYAAANPAPYVFNSIQNGNNFAVGNARVNAAPKNPQYVNVPPLSRQLDDLLARGPLDSRALYAISGGPNDVFAQISAASDAAAITGIERAANDLTAQVTRLQSAGAQHLIVIGIMNLSKVPVASMPGQIPDPVRLGKLVSTFNASLESGLAGKNLLYFNTVKLLDTLIANPAAYGFTNVLDAATLQSIGHAPDPGKETGYLFADVGHPSAQFHKIESDWIYASLEGASRVGLLSQVPLGRSGAQWRSIDGRLNEFQNFGYQGQGFFVTGDHAASKTNAHAGSPSADGSGNSLIMGYEKAFSEQRFAGVTLGYGNAPFDLGNHQGSVRYNEWALSAFAAQKFGAFYANALASYAWLDYTSKRNVALGPFTTRERGETRGRQFGAKAQLGYNFTQGSLVHGPLVGLAWERVKVDGFKEQSGGISALAFGDQVRESLRSRLGWQIALETEWSAVKVRPYVQLTYDHEHKKDERTYRAGFVGTNSALAMPTRNRTGGYGTLLAGFSAELSQGKRLGLGAMTTLSQAGANNTAINLTLSTTF